MKNPIFLLIITIAVQLANAEPGGGAPPGGGEKFDKNAAEQSECTAKEEKMMKGMKGQDVGTFSSDKWMLQNARMLMNEPTMAAKQIEMMLCRFGAKKTGLGWTYGEFTTITRTFEMGERKKYMVFVAEAPTSDQIADGYDIAVRMCMSDSEITTCSETDAKLIMLLSGKGEESKGFAQINGLYDAFEGKGVSGKSSQIVKWNRKENPKTLNILSTYVNDPSSGFLNDGGGSTSKNAAGIARPDSVMEARKKYDSDTGDIEIIVVQVMKISDNKFSRSAVIKGNLTAKTATVCITDMSGGGKGGAATDTGNDIPANCYDVTLDSDGMPDGLVKTLSNAEKATFQSNNTALKPERSPNDLANTGAQSGGAFKGAAGAGSPPMRGDKRPAEFFSK